MSDIHPTAIVDSAARIGANVRIGPYCVVGPHARLDDDVVLHSHVVVEGHTTVGARTEIYPFASIGHAPQDLKFKGEESTLEIGTDNIIRENVTMNPGTAGGGMVTRVGNHCAFLAGSHVGHDSKVGNYVVFSNNVMLAGHCTVEDYVIFGGGAALQQFGRVGKHAFIGGMSGVENDVIPFGLVIGNRAHMIGLNLVGLKRRGFSRQQISALREAYDLIFAPEGALRDRVAKAAELYADNPDVMTIVNFIQDEASRGLVVPKQGQAA